MTKIIQNNTRVFNFSALADIRALRGADMKQGDMVVYTGNEDSDGTERLYLWSTTSTDTDDSDSTLKLTDTTTGRLKAIPPVRIRTPQDYGALADDSTDDTAAFNAAIAANDVVHVPAGTYRTEGEILVASSTTIFGDGIEQTIINNATAGADADGFKVTASGVTIRGMTLNGPSDENTYVSEENGISLQGESGTEYGKIRVEDMRITKYGHAGISGDYCNNINVSRVEVANCGYAGMIFQSCDDGQISDCKVYTIVVGTSSNSYGISITDRLGVDVSQRWNVSNCFVDDVRIWTAYDTHGAKDVTFSNCSSANCAYGVNFSRSSVTNAPPVRCVAIGGTHDRGTATVRGRGIGISGFDASNYAEGCGAIGVSLKDYGPASNSDGAVLAQWSKGTFFGGITIEDADGAGFQMLDANQDFVVSGNTLRNFVASPVANASAVTLRNATAKQSGYVGGNNFGLDDEYAVYATASMDEVEFGDNRLEATRYTGTHDAATSATVLTDSTASFPGSNGLAGWFVFNTTDGSIGKISSNTGTTATVSALVSGTDNDFDSSDAYKIVKTFNTELLYSGASSCGKGLELYASQQSDVASIASSGTATFNVTVTGAEIGDDVVSVRSYDSSIAGLMIAGQVTAADTVRVEIFNPTAGAVDPDETFYTAVVRKAKK